MFEDIHHNLEINRFPGIDFSEILYADDTVLITQDAESMNKLLDKVESEALEMGLAFNKKKCAAIIFNSNDQVVFKNG